MKVINEDSAREMFKTKKLGIKEYLSSAKGEIEEKDIEERQVEALEKIAADLSKGDVSEILVLMRQVIEINLQALKEISEKEIRADVKVNVPVSEGPRKWRLTIEKRDANGFMKSVLFEVAEEEQDADYS